VAAHDDAFIDPQVEVADPEPLVDHRDQRLHVAAAALGNLEVEGAGEVQRLDVVHPGVRELIIGPATGHENRDLVVARAFERPVVDRRDSLDHVQRVQSGIVGVAREGHDVSALPIGARETHATERARLPCPEAGARSAI